VEIASRDDPRIGGKKDGANPGVDRARWLLELIEAAEGTASVGR
jgi:hypothetical protein